jgi:ribonuclease HII
MMTTCGFDEAGRGPLAGPVTAACVTLGPGFDSKGLGDSKALTARQRKLQFDRIRQSALAWGIGWVSPKEIDQINILQASLLAMSRAWDDMAQRFPDVHPDLGLVDGLYCPPVALNLRAIVGGDALEPCISAASIVAKVLRDEEMEKLDRIYPAYGLAKNKGYPTQGHRDALEQWGPSPVHRLSFRWKPGVSSSPSGRS